MDLLVIEFTGYFDAGTGGRRKMSDKNKKRRIAKAKRKIRIRKKVSGTAECPRLTVYRSNRFMYAQVIDDVEGSTLLASDSGNAPAAEIPKGIDGKCAQAYQLGRSIADLAKEKGIAKIVFDRSGYLYHGRVAALAKGARDGGLKF